MALVFISFHLKKKTWVNIPQKTIDLGCEDCTIFQQVDKVCLRTVTIQALRFLLSSIQFH